MAGTSYDGVSDDALTLLPGADLIGRSPLQGIPFAQWAYADGGSPAVHDAFPLLAEGGSVTEDSSSGGSSPPVARPGIAEADATSFAADWFERAHLLPRTKLQFGNIITLVEREFELFNAFRNTTLTITSITNNVLPGVELPTLAVSDAAGPLSGFLGPTSTSNSGGTSLGTMVQQKVQALEDGLPLFDSSIVFGFNEGDDVTMFLSGVRIVFLPMEYESPVTEVLAFLTDVIESLDGHEQRIALRKNPRQRFRVEYALDGNDRQRMHVLLMDWMDNTFGFPLWHEQVKLTTAAGAGTTTYNVTSTADADFRVGGLAVVITDANTFDVINIASVTSSTIVAADSSLNAYPAGTVIMPMRTARITSAVTARKSQLNLEVFRVEFEVVDNDTGQPAASTSGWSSYGTRVLFDDCNVVGSGENQTITRRLYVIDNQTGKVSVRSPWDRAKRRGIKGFGMHNRAEIMKVRQLLLATRGRQKAFWLPSFFSDVTVKAGLVNGAATMDIQNIEYTRFAQSRQPKVVLRVTFTDGTSLDREVQSAAVVDATTERLTLDDVWPADRDADEVSRVMFFELMRFDSDEFTITYPRIGLARMQAPVIALFDDN